MDKTIRLLLSLAIAIIYPLVVYVTVVTVLPLPDRPDYPDYPSCSRSIYDASKRRSVPNPNCQSQYARYDEEVADYRKAEEKKNEKNVNRAQLALIIALLTMIFALFIRDVKELTGGLIAGASMIVIAAASVVLGYDNNPPSWPSLVVLVAGFIVLTVMLFVVDKFYPHELPDKTPGEKQA